MASHPSCIKIHLALLAAALSVMALLPASAGAIDWTGPAQVQTLSPEGVNGGPAVTGVDAEGNFVGAWTQSNGAVSQIWANDGPAAGFFKGNDSYLVSPAGENSTAPQIAVARDGTAVLAWTREVSGSNRDIAVSVRPPGGRFGPMQILTPEFADSLDAAIAVDPGGNFILTWVRREPFGFTPPQTTASELVSSYRPAGSSTWGTPQSIDNILPANQNVDAFIYQPRIVMDRQGNALVAYELTTAAFNQDRLPQSIYAAQRPPGSGAVWGPRAQVATRGTSKTVANPAPALHDGNALVAYDFDFGAGRIQVEAVYRAAGQTAFGPKTVLYPSPHGGDNAGGASADFDPDGNALVTWITFRSSKGQVMSAFRPAGASSAFAANVPVSPLADNATAVVMGMDDSGNAIAVWRESDANADLRLRASVRAAGPSGAFETTPHQLSDFGDWLNFAYNVGIGPNGATVASWPERGAGNYLTKAAFGYNPKPPPDQPPPLPPPEPPLPPPPPDPPTPSAIQVARPLEAGRASIFTVKVSGQVDRLEWTIEGTKMTGRVVNGRLQDSIRLRIGSGAVNVRVRAVGPGGSKDFARAVAGPKDPRDDAARKVSGSISGSVVAVGEASVLGGTSRTCGPVTVASGGQELNGCFVPVDDLADIPAGERGVLDALADAWRLSANDGALLSRAVELSDGYVATGTLVVNGIWPVVPSGGAKIVLFQQAQALTSSNAAFRVGGHSIAPPTTGFRLRLPTRRDDINLGSVRRPSSLTNIGGFKYTGDFRVKLGPSYATIETGLQFPNLVTRNGQPLTVRIAFYASPNEFSGLDNLSIGTFGVNFGPMPIHNFKVTYRQVTNSWDGSGSACVLVDSCLDMAPPNGGIQFANGELVYAKANIPFGDPGRPLGPGVFLENIGFGFGLNPSRLFGSGRIGVGQFLKVDGRMVYAFPSAAAPYRLQRSEVGDSFPANLYNTPITRPMIAMGADMSVDLPLLGAQKLGGGYFLYEFPGYVAFGGGAGFQVLGIIRFEGSLSGQYDVAQPAFNLHGDIRACLPAVRNICAASVSNVSRGPNNAGGAGGCIQLGPISVGGGVQWARPKEPFIWPFDGCKWSRFKLDIRPSKVQAAQAGGPPAYTLEVEDGAPSPAIQLNGAGDAPTVTVTGPGGQSLSSTEAGVDYSPGGKIRIVRFKNADAQFTTVGLQDAQPGTYTVALQPGSPAVTGVMRAEDPVDAKVSGKVSGSGARRTLEYDVLERADQTVTFYDRDAKGNEKAIKTITRGGRGKFAFSPAPGRTLRTIVARFTLNGIDAEEKNVARFRPPSPTLGKPGRVRVARARGNKLALSWRKVPGATTYEIAVTTSDGVQKVATTKGGAVVIKGISTAVAGRVSVRAMADLREGKPATASFKRTKSARGAFTSLPNCSVKKKKLVCSRRR